MSTHLAVAIVADYTADALDKSRSLPPAVTLIEYRLDKMRAINVEDLAAQTPIPAIFTCRPPSQGGDFRGTEKERRQILKRALGTKHLVDIEMETLPALTDSIIDSSRVIGSQHDFGGMLGDWSSLSVRIRALGAGIAKLVGMAATEADALQPLAWLAQMTHPAIAIAMGPAGIATRLLAPRFANAFLTFASLETASAPGQIHVKELTERYGFAHIASAEPLLAMLTPDPTPWELVQQYRRAMTAQLPAARPWLLPIPTRELQPGLMLSLRLARVHGVFRLPQIAAAASLRDYGFDPAGYAWRLANGKASVFPDYPKPQTVMRFFAQGA